MTNSLKQTSARSFFWVALDVFGQRGLQFIIGIVLARLLEPEEFGLLGMISIFIAFSMVFINSGFSFALIRKKTIERIEYTTVFWFSLLVSFLLYALLFKSSPFIADFYNEPILSEITKAIGLILIINAVSSIQNVKLNKELKFKELTIIGFISKITAGILALILAFNGFGVWSLVAQQLVLNFTKTLLMIIYNRFIPDLAFSFSRFKELFNFSYKLLFGGIVEAITRNIYPMVIGKVFAISDVGFFNRAKGLSDMPVLTLTGIIQKVTLPMFSNIQDDHERFLKAYKLSIKSSLFITIIPLIIIIVTAEPLIEFLITDKWLPAAPMLKIISLGAIFYPVSALNVNIIGIQGRSDFVMISQFIKSGFVFIGVLVGLLFGIYGLLWVVAITGNISFLVNIYFTSKVVSYSMKEQLKDLFPVLIISFIAWFIGYILSTTIEGSLIFKIFIESTVVLIIIFGISYLFKRPELYFSIDILKRMIKRKA